MRNLILLILLNLAFAFQILNSQPEIKWKKSFGGNKTDWAESLIQTKDGGFVVVGYTESKGAGVFDVWLIKTDKFGIKQWDKTFGGNKKDMANCIIQTSDEGFAIAGFTQSKGSGGFDMWLIKTDKKGNWQWDITFGGAEDDEAYSLIQTKDDGFVIAGWSDTKDQSEDIFLVKTNKNGIKEWDKTFGGENDDEAKSIIQTADGNFAIIGFTESKGAGGEDIWFIKTDNNGNIKWDKTFGGREDDEAYSIIQTNNGNFAIAGWTKSKGNGKEDMWLLKTDKRGNLLWDKTFGGKEFDEAYSLIQTADQGFVLSGVTASNGNGEADIWLIKTDSKGNEIWDKTLGGSKFDKANALIQTKDNGHALAGQTESKNSTESDLWIINLSPRNIYTHDDSPPIISVVYPDISRSVNSIVQNKQVTIKGKVTDKSGIFEVFVNKKEAYLDAQGNFSKSVLLAIGDNSITVSATDLNQNTSEKNFSIERKSNQEETVVSNNLTNKTGTQNQLYYALIIGVEKYQDFKITSLDRPVSDAQKLHDVLVNEYTFDKQNINFIKNPSRTEITKALDYYFNNLTEDDNLLIFYAGHGYWDEQFEQGYWLAADAEQSNRGSWLSNGTIRDYMRAISAKHVLLITDACFGGGIFKSRNAFSNASSAINQLYKLPSRKAMTSGALSEVPDKSVFIEYFVKRLKQNQEKHLSSEQLFASFKIAVINNSANNQVPQFGEVKETGDEGGDFIFIHK